MSEFTYTCFYCGGSCRLVASKEGRRLHCLRGCGVTAPVPADLALSIRQMAEGMANESLFNKSDKQRREQAKARRAGSTVRTFADSPYLSAQEAATLSEAAEILERIGTAAELAKKELKRKEKAEELRQSARRRAAHAVLFPRLDYPREFTASVPLVLALATTWQDSFNTPGRIDDAIRDALTNGPRWQRTTTERVGFAVNNAWQNITDSVLSSIAYATEEEATAMAERFLVDVDQALTDPTLTERAGALIELINARLVQERLESANHKPETRAH